MSLSPVACDEAQSLIASGARLIDIRERDEHARARIPGALNVPLSELDRHDLSAHDRIVFHCLSGNRTAVNAARLAAAARGPAYVLDGGLQAWRLAGRPVTEDTRRPIEIMRQVQIAAGTLVVTGALLGTFVATGFVALSAFVGAGLVLAGATGWCGMARVLARMPWNRPAASA
jgi:rhodanese-related sulfurtransferase